MLDQKRVTKAQDAIRNLPPNKNLLAGIRYDYEGVADYESGSLGLAGASSVFESIARYTRYQTLFASTSVAERQLSLAFTASVLWLGFDLRVKGMKAGKKISGEYDFVPTLDQQVPLLQAIGWVGKAEQMTSFIWTDFLASVGATRNTLFGLPKPGPHDIITNSYLVHKSAWFTTMTTLSDPNIWRQHGYNPDADSMGPYWMLAQVWDDPDPAVVRNALQATRDLNIGTTFIKINAEHLGLDWRSAYQEIITDIGIKQIRIPIFWDQLEREPGKFDWVDLDWQMQEAAKAKAQVMLVVGHRVPRSPRSSLTLSSS